MGFQSPFSYKNVILLTFENGDLINFNDLSKKAASIRKNKDNTNINENELDDKEWIMHKMKWINYSFDISFDKIRKLL